MKITGVTTYHLPGTRYPWVFLRIDTDAAIHGIGQVSSGPNSAVVAAAARRIGPLLVGEDPSNISGTNSTPASTRSARSASSPP